MTTNPATLASEQDFAPAPIPALRTLERAPDPGFPDDDLIRLNRNERAEPLPEWFVERIRDSITGSLIGNYPALDELYEELAGSLGVERDNLLLTTGSDGGIKALFHAFVQPGDEVVALDPSYAMYEVYTQMFGGRFVGVPIRHDLSIDLQGLLEAIRPGVRLVMIANPNQPTGTLADEETLISVLERAAEVGALVGVDEAYYPFSKFTILPRVHDYPHLVVTRTFSKAAGLAGERIGYLVGHPSVIANAAKVRTISDVTAFGALCAREVLRHPELIDDFVAAADAGKALLAEKATSLGLEPIPTGAGFMLIRVAPRCEVRPLIDALQELGYVVKGPFGSPCIADCIRLTAGPPELMSGFADALERAVERLDASVS